MHYIDIILIVILLIFAIVGLKRGLVDAVLSLFSTLASIILAFFAAKPFAGFLEQCFKLTEVLNKNIYNMLVRWSATFGEAVSSAITGNQAISSSGLSEWQQTILKLVVGECAIETGSAPATVFANIIAPVALIVISGIAAFILIKLAVWLLGLLLNKLKEIKTINNIDKIFGFVLGLVKGALFICIIMGITIFIPNDKIIQEIDKTTITKVAYTPVTNFIRVNIADKLNEWADDILNKNEGTGDPQSLSYTLVLPEDSVLGE